VHPIIRRCEFAPNWPISARMRLNVLDWRGSEYPATIWNYAASEIRSRTVTSASLLIARV